MDELAPVMSAIAPTDNSYEPNGAMSFMSSQSQQHLNPSAALGLEHLSCLSRIYVKQQMHIMDELSGYESHNNIYDIRADSGHVIFRALEDCNECSKLCCGSGRTFNLDIYDPHGRQIMHMIRPMSCCILGALTVNSPPGEMIGKVQKRCCSSSFTVKNQKGERVMQIKGPLCSQPCCRGDIVYHIFDKNGKNQIGKISKEWAGEVQESYTFADNYEVSFPVDLDVNLKAVLLGATLLIDFLYYEKRHKKTRRL